MLLGVHAIISACDNVLCVIVNSNKVRANNDYDKYQRENCAENKPDALTVSIVTGIMTPPNN